MNNLFAGQKDEWIALANIDYFGAFIKAYIPFNAWMNYYYPSLQKDREKINTVKSTPNTFRNKICALLDLDSQEGSHFRNLIGDLHDMLEKHYIHNQDKRITFTNITLGRNPENVGECSRFGIGFRVQYGNRSANSTNTHSLIKKRDGSAIFNFNQSNYNIEELKANSSFVTLSTDYQNLLLDCYKKVEPYIQINFTLIPTGASYFECGDYRFVKESENLAKGLIEIIYNLRCSLFHGEIVPNKEANQVYGAAYRILYILIQSL